MHHRPGVTPAQRMELWGDGAESDPPVVEHDNRERVFLDNVSKSTARVLAGSLQAGICN